MADKTWTATDIRMLDLRLKRVDNNLELTSFYQFLNAQGQPLSGIEIRRLTRLIPLANLPQNVISALQLIDTFRKNQALQQEGMA